VGSGGPGPSTAGRQTNLVSIGYSACHWCHVMAHECFEDDAIAGLMNDHLSTSRSIERNGPMSTQFIWRRSRPCLGKAAGRSTYFSRAGRPSVLWGTTSRRLRVTACRAGRVAADGSRAYTQRRSEYCTTQRAHRAIAAAQNRQPEGGNPGVDVLQQALSTMLTQRDLGHGIRRRAEIPATIGPRFFCSAWQQRPVVRMSKPSLN
jgi:hypothetical protein